MGEFITFCIVGFIAYKVYRFFFVAPVNYQQALVEHDMFDLGARMNRTLAGHARSELEEENRRDDATAILRQAREIASRTYAESLLKGTPTDQDREAFELNWSRAKEAVKAKFGKKTLKHALLELDLDHE